jgi:hypothetical protein
VLGPRVAIRANDPERRPLDELLAADILAGVDAPEREASLARTNLRRAAELHYRLRHDREELELAVQDFYAREGHAVTDFHRDLAQLPFKLCVNASPDSLMLRAFAEAGKSPQEGHYSFRRAVDARLSSPTRERPLVYYLFGHPDDPRSLVLTEGDLIEFLVSIVRGVPPVPDHVRSLLADPAASFLFLGFGFQNWYLRVLLQVMNVYGHRSKAIAFEDAQFFEHPDRDQAVGFFSGDRLIDFRPLHWEAFARHLREAYGTGAAGVLSQDPSSHESLSPNSPLAFISYAGEDVEEVITLSEKLKSRGIRIWRDKDNLRGGDNWQNQLKHIIEKKADYVIVVMALAMTTRIKGEFKWEIAAAQKEHEKMGEFEGERLRFLIPVKTGQCKPLASLESYHVIDLDQPQGLDALVTAIQEDWQRRSAMKLPRTTAA